MFRIHLSNEALCGVIRNALAGIIQWFVIAILLARALIPVNVMIDMGSAKQGRIALTLCSGHGPMFARAVPPGSDLASSHMHHRMGNAVSKSADGTRPPGLAAPADNGFCPFSSALVVAYVALAFCMALIARRPTRHFRKTHSGRPPWRPLLYGRPLTSGTTVFLPILVFSDALAQVGSAPSIQ